MRVICFFLEMDVEFLEEFGFVRLCLMCWGRVVFCYMVICEFYLVVFICYIVIVYVGVCFMVRFLIYSFFWEV